MVRKANRNFSRQGRFLRIKTFDKYFIKDTQRRDLARKNFEVFSLRYS